MNARIAATLLGVALALAPARGAAGPPEASTAPAGAPAAALKLRDPAGRVVDLAGRHGRPAVVNFWASWCGPCRYEIPDLSAFWRAGRDRCFDMFGVAEDSGTPREVAQAAKRLGIAYPVLVDTAGDAAEAFGVVGLPQTIVLDREGRIVKVFLGPIGKAELDAALAPLLPAAGKPCPRA